MDNRIRKIEIEKDKVSQKKLALKEAENKFDNLSLELNLAQSNMSILENLYKKKVVSRKEYLSELSKKQSIVTRLDETRNRLPILKEEIEEAKKRVESVKSQIRSKLLKQYSSLKIEINKLIEKIEQIKIEI